MKSKETLSDAIGAVIVLCLAPLALWLYFIFSDNPAPKFVQCAPGERLTQDKRGNPQCVRGW